MSNRWRGREHPNGRQHRPWSALGAFAALLIVLAGCGASGGSSESATSSSTSSTASSTTSLPDSTTSITPATVASSTTVAVTTAPPPPTNPPPTTAPPANRVVYDLDSFQLPSGNIQCILMDDYVGCEIGNRTWDPPQRPAGCDGEWGDRVEMDADGWPRFGCHGDTVRGDWPVLGYGTTAVTGPFSCTSAKSGLTCTRSNGHGFSLARGSYRIF